MAPPLSHLLLGEEDLRDLVGQHASHTHVAMLVLLLASREPLACCRNTAGSVLISMCQGAVPHRCGEVLHSTCLGLCLVLKLLAPER